jgi:hypothetical protein
MVKYNKVNKSLTGNINTIIRRVESDAKLHIYQVKGNTMTSLTTTLATATKPASSVFIGKATIQDITNDDKIVLVESNAVLQVTMTDAGEPGKYDMIAIQVQNKAGGLWFASNWTGTQTVQQQIGGGNIQINQGSGTTGTTATSLTVTSSKNPIIKGETVLLTATIVEADTKAAPTGFVMFLDGESLLGYGAINTSTNKATLSVAGLASGLHTIKAYYNGDSKFKSCEGSFVQTVNVAATVSSMNTLAGSISGGDDNLYQDFGLKVFENPTSNYFKVSPINKNTNAKMQLRILTVFGAVIETKSNIHNGELIEFGARYPHGSYFIELTSGEKRKVMKLLKIN